MIGGIVLAAGSGTRFGPGTSKLLSPLNGQPVLAHVVATMRTVTDPTVVVVGYQADRVRVGVDLTGTEVVHNYDYALGMASSLALGLAQMPNVEGAVVALGDQPGITPAVVHALVAAYQRELTSLVVPVYGGQRGNPVFIARPVFPQASRIAGDTGARSLMEAHPRWVTEVVADGLADPRDIDTPDDLRALQEQREQQQ